MEYMTTKEAAEKWKISPRRVTKYCEDGRIENTEKLGNSWAIPKDSKKPQDKRIKSGKYMKNNSENTEYVLKQYDTVLLCFTMKREFDGLSCHITWIDDEKRNILPIDLIQTDEGLLKWLRYRTIPTNRAYVENFLARLGINEKDTKGIIDICKGLSLNDSYWTPSAKQSGTYKEHNLFDNNFSNTLAEIAFTGHGSMRPSDMTSSPEFTTNGMLAKAWRRDRRRILLFKSGTEGAANTGKEPFSEYYAYQVAEKMKLNAVKYGLAMWKEKLCSTCELFTNIDTSFVPIGRIVRDGGIKAVLEYYRKLGNDYYQEIVDMLVFDAVICNTDRHLGNLGVLVDNGTNTVTAAAPIFDNGLSLFCYAMDEDLENIDAYAQTRTPATYPDFVVFAKEVMTKRQRDKLRFLLEFKFKKNPRYNLPNYRLNIIEGFIRRRAAGLLSR